MKRSICSVLALGAMAMFLMVANSTVLSEVPKEDIYSPGALKPTDSNLKVNVGDPLPDFNLSAVSGGQVSLSQFLGEKNLVIPFVPAAWTTVCSDHWPGYNIAKEVFDRYDAILLGILVDNIPTLYAWTN